MRKLYLFLTLMTLFFGIGQAAEATEGNVTFTIDNPDAIYANYDYEGLVLQPGTNYLSLQPGSELIVYANSGYDILTCEGLQEDWGWYVANIESGKHYDITITTGIHDSGSFIINIDDASRVEADYDYSTYELVTGENVIPIKEYCSFRLKAKNGYRISDIEGEGFNYIEYYDSWNLYTNPEIKDRVYNVYTEEFNPTYADVTVNVAEGTDMYSFYFQVNYKELTLNEGTNTVNFREDKNKCQVQVAYGSSYEGVDVRLNGERLNVVNHIVYMELSAGDVIDIALLPNVEDRTFTLNINDADALTAQMDNTPIELQNGENTLDCSTYHTYSFRTKEGYRVADAIGGFDHYDWTPNDWMISITGDEAGNVYTLTTVEYDVQYASAIFHTDNPEKVQNIRIGYNYYEMEDGYADIRWDAEGLNQLVITVSLEDDEMAVLTQNGTVVSPDYQTDWLDVMVEDGDVIELSFERFDKTYDVWFDVMGPREGVIIEHDGETVEGSSIAAHYEDAIIIYPLAGYEIASLAIDGTRFDADADGVYTIYTYSDMDVTIKVNKLYYVVAQNCVYNDEVAIEVAIVDDEEGDLVKEYTAHAGDVLYLNAKEMEGFEMECFTAAGLALEANTVLVCDEYTEADGHTIIISARYGETGVAALEMNENAEYYDLNGIKVNGNIMPGVYLRKTAGKVEKVMVK